MEVVIQSIKFDADKKLIDFTTKKVEKLDKFFDAIVGADVILKLESAQDPENKCAEVRLLIPGNELFAERKCKSFEEAVSESVDAIIRQLQKTKEKMRGE